jgi:hypothetical protein
MNVILHDSKGKRNYSILLHVLSTVLVLLFYSFLVKKSPQDFFQLHWIIIEKICTHSSCIMWCLDMHILYKMIISIMGVNTSIMHFFLNKLNIQTFETDDKFSSSQSLCWIWEWCESSISSSGNCCHSHFYLFLKTESIPLNRHSY